MENLTPPPYKPPDNVPQISDFRNHLRTLMQIQLPFNIILESNKVEESMKISETDMKSKTYVNRPPEINEAYGSQENFNIDNVTNYKTTTDKATLDYLSSHDTQLPYSINTVHFQNPYRLTAPLEGYAPRKSGPKVMYRIRETTLRPRHGNLIHKKKDEISTVESYGEDQDKSGRSRMHGDDFRLCFKKSEIGVTAQQYCLSSTLHGLRYVGDSNLSLLERFFWIISFITAFITAGYFIWNLYHKWTDTPIIISLSPEPVPLTDIPFPSITVCNMNNALETEAGRINRGTDELQKLFLNDLCNFENGTFPTDVDVESGKWDNVQRFMINVSQSCTDMLFLCRWHQNTTDCSKMFNPTLTDEGICCNFNSVHRKYMFYKPSDLSDLNVTYPYSSVDWTPESGYPPGTSAESIPWRPYGAGRHLGLTLVLDAEVQNYYCSSTASVGFKMLLHNPIETPKIADFAFSITPGEETRIIIRPTISSASRTILRTSRKKRRCFFASERVLKYYRTYTQRNCIMECEANFTLSICRCVQHYMPKSPITKICGKRDDPCANTARRLMEMKLYDDSDDIFSQLNVTKTPSCNCLPSCFEINYSTEISQSKLVSNFDVDTIYVKRDRKYFVENMAVVHLYFLDSQFTAYTKNELFGFTEFLSNTGGLLGLFMGFSFLSVVEVLYFITMRLWCRLYRHRSPSHTLLQVLPANHQNIVYPFAQ